MLSAATISPPLANTGAAKAWTPGAFSPLSCAQPSRLIRTTSARKRFGSVMLP